MPAPHITVPDQTPLLAVAVTTSQTAFPFEFTYFDPTDLRVTVDCVELSQSAFEVVGTGGYEGGYPGGTVTLDDAVENCTVIIWSETPPTRINDFVEGAGLPARAVNTELDRATARLRDMRLRLQRTPTLTYALAHALTAAQSGQFFTNDGGIDAYTLPAPSAGLEFTFAVTEAVQLDIVSADTIYDADASGTMLSADAIGSMISVRAVDADTWLVFTKNGTWSLA